VRLPSYLRLVKKPRLALGYTQLHVAYLFQNFKPIRFQEIFLTFLYDAVIYISMQVEHIIREENMMAAQEILELFCELVSVRLPIIESQRYFRDRM